MYRHNRQSGTANGQYPTQRQLQDMAGQQGASYGLNAQFSNMPGGAARMNQNQRNAAMNAVRGWNPTQVRGQAGTVYQNNAVRIDQQGFTRQGGYNMQAQLNGPRRGGSSTVGHVNLPPNYGSNNPANQRGAQRLAQQAMYQSIATGRSVDITGRVPQQTSRPVLSPAGEARRTAQLREQRADVKQRRKERKNLGRKRRGF